MATDVEIRDALFGLAKSAIDAADTGADVGLTAYGTTPGEDETPKAKFWARVTIETFLSSRRTVGTNSSSIETTEGTLTISLFRRLAHGSQETLFALGADIKGLVRHKRPITDVVTNDATVRDLGKDQYNVAQVSVVVNYTADERVTNA